MSVFGQGAIDIGGRKISYGLLAAGAGIVGAILLVIQMRKAQSGVGAGVSPSPNTSLDPSLQPGSSGNDISSGLAALSQQIAGLNNQTAQPSASAASSPGQVAAAAGYQNYSTQWGNTGARTAPTLAQPSNQPAAPVVTPPKASYSTYVVPTRVTRYISVPVTRPAGSRAFPYSPSAVGPTSTEIAVQEVNPPGSTAQQNVDATGYVLTSQYGAGL